jgi:hypothetical protein
MCTTSQANHANQPPIFHLPDSMTALFRPTVAIVPLSTYLKGDRGLLAKSFFTCLAK